MKQLNWKDIFRKAGGDVLSEDGYKIEVIKPNTPLLEMIEAWREYTFRSCTKDVRVFIIDDKVFPSDYLMYRIRSSSGDPVSCEIPMRNAYRVSESYAEFLSKRVAMTGHFMRIPQDLRYFDLYIRLAPEPVEKPVVVVQPMVLLNEWQLDREVERMNKEFREGNVVRIPSYMTIVDKFGVSNEVDDNIFVTKKEDKQ